MKSTSIYKLCIWLPLLISVLASNAQVLNSEVDNAHGDSPNIRIANSQAASTTNDRRATVWLDNDGKMKFRNVAGHGIAFRNHSNTADVVHITNEGSIGIGISNPISRLQIGDGSVFTIGNHSNANVSSSIHFAGFRDTGTNYFGASIEASPNWLCCNGFPGAGYAGVKYINLDFYVHGDYEQASSKKLAMSVRSSGDVTIGTTDSRGYKLAVNGNIRAKEVKVETANWPDYVFGEDYKLPDLKELSAYIRENRHLPGMPSASEAEADGIDLGEMNRKLLEKVEELTLLLIKMEQSYLARMEGLEATVRSTEKIYKGQPKTENHEER